MFDDLAAKFVKDVRTIRRKDDKFETEKVVLVDSCKEQKSIEDLAYLPQKTANLLVADAMHGFSLRGRELERGVDSSFCNCENTPLSRISNAHNSSQRTATSSLGEVVSSIQSNPSPEFLNSLPFIKKFYPAPHWGEGGFTKARLDNNFNSPETVHSHSLKHAAFTLAEVLITLGIIGVVASLTLPTLIQNYQKTVWVNQLKKTISSVENNTRHLLAEEGVDKLSDTKTPFAQDYEGDDDEELSFFAKNYSLKLIENENSLFYQDAIDAFEAPPFYSPDGTCLAFGLNNVYSPSDREMIGMIAVDINCDKKPNLVGYDRFTIYLRNNGLMVTESDMFFPESNCMAYFSSHQEDEGAYWGYCGATFLRKVINDGWKINY